MNLQELLLAIIVEMNTTTAFVLVAVSLSLGIWATNRQWAKQAQRSKEMDHEARMLELRTEERVKLERLTSHPVEHNGPQIEHRSSDRTQEEY